MAERVERVDHIVHRIRFSKFFGFEKLIGREEGFIELSLALINLKGEKSNTT